MPFEIIRADITTLEVGAIFQTTSDGRNDRGQMNMKNPWNRVVPGVSVAADEGFELLGPCKTVYNLFQCYV